MLAPSRASESRASRVQTAIESYVSFAVGTHAYGVDVAIVREVVTIDRQLAVPGAPAPVVGVFAVRGATIALVDTQVLFGIGRSTRHDRALVIASGHRTYCGLTVDHVSEVSPFLPAHFTPAVPGRDAPEIAGYLATEGAALITLLDTNVLIRSLERLRF